MNEDDYGTGYADGKAKGLFECAIAVGHMSVTPECRWLTMRGPTPCHAHHAWAYAMPCTPCVGLRHAMHTMSEATPGPSAPVPEPGLCLGCGHRGMLINNVCSKCWV